jgi:hypothetical protein
MDIQRIKEIEEKIADLERRWPSHSVPPGMWQELEDLEEELELAREAGADATDPGEAAHPGGATDGR